MVGYLANSGGNRLYRPIGTPKILGIRRSHSPLLLLQNTTVVTARGLAGMRHG